MLRINRILSKKIKPPLSLQGLFPFCHSRLFALPAQAGESGNPSSLSLRGAKRRSNLNGFSLIELMVAVAILAMAMFGIFHAYSVGFMGMADARDRTVATNYAREAMEDIKNKSFGEIVNDLYNPNDPLGQIKFKRSVNVDYINDDGDIANEGEVTNLKQVTLTVSWVDRNEQEKTVMLETLIYNNDS